MVKQYKQKVHTFQAVEFTDALVQAPEVADMLGAKSLSVDMNTKSAKFTVGDKTYEVKVGQVVSIDDGLVTVDAAEDFYTQFEQV